MKNIFEIDHHEFNLNVTYVRLMNVSLPNHFYRFEIGDARYFFDTNDSIESSIIEAIPNLERIVLLSEQRLYLFSTLTGNITMALRLWAPEMQLLTIAGFIILITEREVYKIDIKDSIIHSLYSLSDTYIKYSLEGNNLVVYTFDNNNINIII